MDLRGSFAEGGDTGRLPSLGNRIKASFNLRTGG
jgi:hypothetical protein